MNLQTWVAFCTIAALNIFSPGPAILLAISNGATKGMLAALGQAPGNAVGLFIVSLISIIGVGAILAPSATAFTFVKLIGATYLIYLGVKQILSRNKGLGNKHSNKDKAQTNAGIFWQGFTIAVTNPKAILFFIALFPLFLDQSNNVVAQFFIMTLSFQAISIISLTGYAFLSRAAKSLFARKGFLKGFKTATGGLFIALGIGLLKVSSTQR